MGGTMYRKGPMGMFRERFYKIEKNGMLTYTDNRTMGAGVEFNGSLSLGETSIKYNTKKTTEDKKFLGRFGIGGKFKKHEASIEITQQGGGKIFGDLHETIRVSNIESDKKFVKDLLTTYNHLKSQGIEKAEACLQTIGTKIPANYKPSRRRRRMAQRQFSSRRDSPVNRRRRRRLNNRESPDSDTATHRRVLKNIRGY